MKLPRVPMPAFLRRLIRSDKGTELVEFTMAALVLILLLFGTIDFCRAMYTLHFVSYAAQEGARYAAVRGNTAGTACTTFSSFNCTASSANVAAFVWSLDISPDLSTATTVNAITSAAPTATPSPAMYTGTGPTIGNTCATTNNAPGCYVKVVVTYNFHYWVTTWMPTGAQIFTSTSQQVIQY